MQKDKIEKLRQRLSDPTSDRVKIEFLIERLREMKSSYGHDRQMSIDFEKQHKSLFATKDSTVDFTAKRLFITLKTDNHNGGHVDIVFDMSEIDSIRDRIIHDIIVESAWAFGLALIVLGLLSLSIVRPIKRLSHFLSGEFATLEPRNVPFQNKHDEIGTLSRSISQLLEQIKIYVKRLEQLSKNDPLTGLLNRRALDEVYERLIQYSKGDAIGVLYIDIDHFKPYNDTYGHNAGDIALQKTAQAIERSIHRRGDHPFRLGGEEFVVLLLVENKDDLLPVAHRVCDNVEALQIEHTNNLSYGVLTVSIGASFHPNDEFLSLVKMLESADRALYDAKAEGRNRVVLEVK